MNATIQFVLEGTRGYYEARDECGACCGKIEASERITAKTDSHDVVSRFDFPAKITSVDHDGEFIHVGFDA